MSPAKIKTLLLVYPRLLKPDADISCGDGWFVIIDGLLQAISKHVVYQRHIRAVDLIFNRRLARAIASNDIKPLIDPYRYAGVDIDEYLIKQANADLDRGRFRVPEPYRKYPTVLQIGEIFGSLRFYCQGMGIDPVIKGMISAAESISCKTCEICGAQGHLTAHGGHFLTRCSEHEFQLQE